MRKIVLLVVCLFFSSLARVHAAPHVHVTLLSETTTISGKPFWVALKFEHDAHWHTYWKNPGDSGLATKVSWTLPAGFTAGPLNWPTPKRIEAPPLTSFGYEGVIYFLTQIRPPSQVKMGDKVTIQAELSWLECQEECVPGKAAVEKTLSVAKDVALDPQLTPTFSEARSVLPLISTEWNVTGYSDAQQYSFIFTPPTTGGEIEALKFYPVETGFIDNAAVQKLSKLENGWRLDVAKSPIATSPASSFHSVFAMEPGWRGAHSETGWEIEVPLKPGPAPASSARPHVSLLFAILLAFLGGIILNIMPCVLPVLSIKILSLAKQVDATAAQRRSQAFFYGLGVMLTFWSLAAAIYALKAGGHRLGWGFQLQSPNFVIGLILLFVLLTLNLWGVFEIGTSLIGANIASAKGHAFLEPLSSGILAAIVATPCTAPFMGAALGFALASPPIQGILVFTSLGLGMALPFMILFLRPAGLSVLPKPGPWMITMKKFMAGLMLAATVWLIWILGLQSSGRLPPVLISVALLSLAAWIYGRLNPATDLPRRRTYIRAVIALVVLVIALAFFATRAGRNVGAAVAGNWEPYSHARVEELRAQGRPVFIDFTASWCLTCQVNQRVALDRSEVIQAFREKNVALLKADWTNQDESIASALEEYGRSGVPTYVLLSPKSDQPAKILPEVLTPGIVEDALKNL